MKQLKRLIAVYEETFVIKGHDFKIETSIDTKKDKDKPIYYLYDSEEYFIASTRSYVGIMEIAEAYLTGDKQVLEDAKRKYCICNL